MADSESIANTHGSTRLGADPRTGKTPGEPRLRFTFDGRALSALAGETILAALLAEGVRVLRTMPNTGEYRGGYCLVGNCSDCLVIVDGVANVCSCQVSIQEGMIIRTQLGLGVWTGANS